MAASSSCNVKICREHLEHCDPLAPSAWLRIPPSLPDQASDKVTALKDFRQTAFIENSSSQTSTSESSSQRPELSGRSSFAGEIFWPPPSSSQGALYLAGEFCPITHENAKHNFSPLCNLKCSHMRYLLLDNRSVGTCTLQHGHVRACCANVLSDRQSRSHPWPSLSVACTRSGTGRASCCTADALKLVLCPSLSGHDLTPCQIIFILELLHHSLNGLVSPAPCAAPHLAACARSRAEKGDLCPASIMKLVVHSSTVFCLHILHEQPFSLVI